MATAIAEGHVMESELQSHVHAFETRPSPKVVAAAEEAATKAGRSFNSTDKIFETADLLARVYLSRGDLSGMPCYAPRSCVVASLVYVWLHRSPNEHFAIPAVFKSEVKERLSQWPQRSQDCSCTRSYSTRKSEMSAALAFRRDQGQVLLRQQAGISNENILDAQGRD